jgi:hypothetical protein
MSYVFNWSKQRKLEQKYNTQPTICDCGYPIAPTIITLREGFLTSKRIFEQYMYTCKKCGVTQKLVI